MENMTTASISLGEVKGVLKKIQNVSDIKKSAFIYSAETGIRVSVKMTNIHIFFSSA